MAAAALSGHYVNKRLQQDAIYQDARFNLKIFCFPPVQKPTNGNYSKI